MTTNRPTGLSRLGSAVLEATAFSDASRFDQLDNRIVHSMTATEVQELLRLSAGCWSPAAGAPP